MKALLADLERFRDERGWRRHHTPRNIAEAISVEAGELLECFLWDGELARDGANELTELADILIYALNLCLVLNIDPESLIRSKMAVNAMKYPVA